MTTSYTTMTPMSPDRADFKIGPNPAREAAARPLSAGVAAEFSYAKGGIIKGPVNVRDMPTDILRVACAGRKIEAIKMYRDRFHGAGLKESKDAVEAAVSELAPWERDLLAKEAPARSPLFRPASMMQPVTFGMAEDDDGELVYVAGPMTGLPGHNFPAFLALTKHLRMRGWKVNCPAENFGGDPTREFSEYMAKDLRMVLDSEGIVLMPGWRNSKGARIEATMAKALGHRFYEARLVDDDGAGVNPHLPESWVVFSMETPKTTEVEGPDTDARALVFGDRNKEYGPPDLDFMVVGRIWAALLSAHLQVRVDDIPPAIVAVMLAGLKLGRLGRTPEHRDGRVDLIGYGLCLDRIVTGDDK